jgi:hypothetical protein
MVAPTIGGRGEAGLLPTKWALPAQGARAAAQSSSSHWKIGGTPPPPVLALSVYFQQLKGISFLQIRLSKGVIAKFVFRNGLRAVFYFWEWKRPRLPRGLFSILCIQYRRWA